jgi:hypothetical protein
MRLALHQLEDLFGAVPSGRVLERLDFEALRPVLLAIQRQEPDNDPSLTAPSVSKLERNALSIDAAGLLRQGRRREQLVEAFFDGWPDPDLGEEIAQAIRGRYQALKSAVAGSVNLHDRLARGRVMSQPLSRFGVISGMIETADNLAGDGRISREACDEYAAASHQRTAAAWAAGKFDDELVPVAVPQKRGGAIGRRSRIGSSYLV